MLNIISGADAAIALGTDQDDGVSVYYDVYKLLEKSGSNIPSCIFLFFTGTSLTVKKEHFEYTILFCFFIGVSLIYSVSGVQQ